MGAISGDVNSGPMECLDPADLASRPTNSKKSGDLAYVVSLEADAAGPYFFYRAGSTLPASSTVIDPSAGGSGRWLSLAAYGGLGGAVPPLSRELFVDALTTTATADQDGSIGKPFATIQQAVDVAKTFATAPSGTTATAVIYVASGIYVEDVAVSGDLGSLGSLAIVGESALSTLVLGSFTAAPTALPGPSEELTIDLANIAFRNLAGPAVDIDNSAYAWAKGVSYFRLRNAFVFGVGNSISQVREVEILDTLFLSILSCTLTCGALTIDNSKIIGAADAPINISVGVNSYSAYDSNISNTIFLCPVNFSESGWILNIDANTVFSRTATFTPSAILTDSAFGLRAQSSFYGVLTLGTSVPGSYQQTTWDLSGASISNNVNAEMPVAVGATRASLIALGAYFTNGNINLTGAVDADLSGSSFSQTNLNGAGTGETCRRVVNLPNTLVAGTPIAIPAPILPDTNYQVVVTPVSAAAAVLYYCDPLDRAQDTFGISFPGGVPVEATFDFMLVPYKP